jgi:hypothetical protein
MKGGPSNPTDMFAGLGRSKSQARQPGRSPALLGELPMRIAADGSWYYQGTIIARPALVKLFASVLRREADGQYWLVTPAERGRIAVEDAPFTAVEVTAYGSGRGQALVFRSNLDEEATADEAHPIRIETDPASDAPKPYILIRDGLEARILRPVFYHLVELGEAEGDRFGVWSSGRFFPLGRLDPGL